MKIILFFITSVPFDEFQVQGFRVQRLQPMDTAYHLFSFELSPFTFDLSPFSFIVRVRQCASVANFL